MMSIVSFGEPAEELRALVEAACRLQQSLLGEAQRLLVTFERQAAGRTVEGEVHGYTAHMGPGRLEASEQAAMRDHLRQDIQTLQRLTEPLAKLSLGPQVRPSPTAE
jgi:hypothetical protein